MKTANNNIVTTTSHEKVHYIRKESKVEVVTADNEKYLETVFGHRIGAFVSVKVMLEDGSFRVGIGVSKCNANGDKFDSKRAVQIARGRAIKAAETSRGGSMPSSVASQYRYFSRRCASYYNNPMIPALENLEIVEPTVQTSVTKCEKLLEGIC